MGHLPVLGAKAVQELKLLTINEETFKRVHIVQTLPTTKAEVLNCYAPVFKNTVGSLPDPVHLTLDTKMESVIMRARKLPLSMEEPVKHELEQLVSKGVLAPTEEPPRWVSQMAVVAKPSDALRICINPRGLNKALVRERLTLPTLDTMLYKVQGAKSFLRLICAMDTGICTYMRLHPIL